MDIQSKNFRKELKDKKLHMNHNGKVYQMLFATVLNN